MNISKEVLLACCTVGTLDGVSKLPLMFCNNDNRKWEFLSSLEISHLISDPNGFRCLGVNFEDVYVWDSTSMISHFWVFYSNVRRWCMITWPNGTPWKCETTHFVSDGVLFSSTRSKNFFFHLLISFQSLISLFD